MTDDHSTDADDHSTDADDQPAEESTGGEPTAGEATDHGESTAGEPTDGGEPAAGGPAVGGEATDGEASTDDEATAASTAEEPPETEPEAEDRAVAEYLLKGALVLLVVLGVVATLQFYLSATTAIARLAGDDFVPVYQAAFNLVVLLAVGIGVAQIVRRLR